MPLTTAANDATASSVLSEQRLLVATEWVPRERLNVRRRVVTETRQIEVTVRREELLIDHAPIGDEPATAGAASSASAGSPAPLVVVLREEVPVVGLQVRPYERVTIGVERVRSDALVEGELAREQAELVMDEQPPQK
jgi:uncharacterized protein (TIGR02271 family)